MTELHYLSIAELSALLQKRKISSVEATRAMFERIGRLDGRLQAYATLMEKSALSEARAADAELARGKVRGPLHGVPIALKDLCYTKGVPTMGGSAALAAFIPDFDGTVVARFRAAGAVILGKLNLTEGAMSAYNPKLKAPYNPWDATMSPGGSSSGSGVAMAAGMAFGSVGSDTGGSIRFPSALCGVVGLKPTWGRVSRYGVLDLAQSLDHVGPMTRTVTDAAIILEAIGGEDPQDPTTIPGPVPPFTALMRKGVRGLRVGYAEEYATKGVDPETAQAVKAALPVLEGQGAVIVETYLPDMLEYISAWRDICTAEALTAHASYYPAQAASYGPWFRSWLAHGASISAADYARAHQARIRSNGIVAKAFRDIDVLVCPAMLGPDRRKTDKELFETPLERFDSARQRFTVPYDFNGAPSVTMPSALNRDGFPLSVQFVAKPGREDLALRAARAFERACRTTSLRPAV